MGRHSYCLKQKLRKGLWSPEEDEKLFNYIAKFGVGSWSSVPKLAGLERCGKSCRLRWINYLRPDIKRGMFSQEEVDLILTLHQALGNRWAQIAAKLPGRSDNEVKNFWNSSLKKTLVKQGIDPATHKPLKELEDDLVGAEKPYWHLQYGGGTYCIVQVPTCSNFYMYSDHFVGYQHEIYGHGCLLSNPKEILVERTCDEEPTEIQTPQCNPLETLEQPAFLLKDTAVITEGSSFENIGMNPSPHFEIQTTLVKPILQNNFEDSLISQYRDLDQSHDPREVRKKFELTNCRNNFDWNAVGMDFSSLDVDLATSNPIHSRVVLEQFQVSGSSSWLDQQQIMAYSNMDFSCDNCLPSLEPNFDVFHEI